MRLGLGLIIGLKGAPHHDRHNQGHREKLEVTTDSSVEVFETTPKLPGKTIYDAAFAVIHCCFV